MRFVFLGPVFCLQLPSDSASPRTPLLLANLYFCLRGSGLTPYSSCTCRAHKYGKSPVECRTLAVQGSLFYTYLFDRYYYLANLYPLNESIKGADEGMIMELILNPPNVGVPQVYAPYRGTL